MRVKPRFEFFNMYKNELIKYDTSLNELQRGPTGTRYQFCMCLLYAIIVEFARRVVDNIFNIALHRATELNCRLKCTRQVVDRHENRCKQCSDTEAEKHNHHRFNKIDKGVDSVDNFTLIKLCQCF